MNTGMTDWKDWRLSHLMTSHGTLSQTGITGGHNALKKGFWMHRWLVVSLLLAVEGFTSPQRVARRPFELRNTVVSFDLSEFVYGTARPRAAVPPVRAAAAPSLLQRLWSDIPARIVSMGAWIAQFCQKLDWYKLIFVILLWCLFRLLRDANLARRHNDVIRNLSSFFPDIDDIERKVIPQLRRPKRPSLILKNASPLFPPDAPKQPIVETLIQQLALAERVEQTSVAYPGWRLHHHEIRQYAIQCQDAYQIAVVSLAAAAAETNIFGPLQEALVGLHQQGYQIVLVGHGEGARAAAFLGPQLVEHVPLEVVTFAPPRCVTLEESKALEAYTTSIVDTLDFYSFLSPKSVDRLRQSLVPEENTNKNELDDDDDDDEEPDPWIVPGRVVLLGDTASVMPDGHCLVQGDFYVHPDMFRSHLPQSMEAKLRALLQ